MELTWKASESASALYAATCLAAGLPVADARLAAAFAPGLEVALAEFAACNVPTERLLPLVTGLASRGVEDNRQLVEQGLAKLVGSRGKGNLGRLAGALSSLKAAYHAAYRSLVAEDAPPLVDELLLRGRPLAEQWEARGPGLLLQIGRLTEENVVTATAEVTLVQPLLGGNGLAHRSLNAVTFEAVLANPVDQLPEVLRLAWLLSQLNLDLPMYGDHVSAAHRETVGHWATIPPVLSAAEYVELAPLSPETLATALVAWRVDAGASADRVDTLLQWWKTYDDSNSPWAVALAALERMLFA